MEIKIKLEANPDELDYGVEGEVNYDPCPYYGGSHYSARFWCGELKERGGTSLGGQDSDDFEWVLEEFKDFVESCIEIKKERENESYS